MAYIDKEKTQKIRNKLKEVFPRKSGWKFSVRKNHGTLMTDIVEAPLNLNEFKGRSINNYHLYQYGEFENTFKKIISVMNGNFLNVEDQNFDNSDPMTDYFHVGWYIRLGVSENFVERANIADKLKLL